MLVTIVGSVNFDRIVAPDGSKKSSLGGILYNLFPLASLLSSDSKIYPLTKVGKRHLAEILRLLRDYPNVDTQGAQLSPRGTNQNLLVYTSDTERDEKLVLRAPRFTFEEVKRYIHSHLILFNFITGSEIPLSLLEETRRNSDALIYVDVHSKVLGMKEDGTRYPLGWPDWEKWLQHTDIVQMNLEECRLLLKERVKSHEALFRAARKIAAVGPGQVLITLGEKGALVYWRDGDEQYELVPASTHEVVDTTGCGDCFTAGYIWGLFKYKAPVKAACIANVVAGENCRAMGLIGELDSCAIERKALKLYPHVFDR
jgi:sugar/nucleoside kinase (ribokinase family)